MTSFRNLILLALTAVFSSVGVVGQVYALSCLRPNLTDSYQRWSESETKYVVARGTLIPTDTLPAKRSNTVDEQHMEYLEAVQYRFSGVLIGKEMSTPVTIRMIVEPRCLAVWCGGYPEQEEEAIYAFEKTSDGYRFRPGPCGGDSFSGDVRAHEKFIRNCMKSGSCPG